MNKFEEYEQQVRSVIHSTRHVLSEAEIAEAEHLVNHGEPPEGLVILAWIIVNGDKRVPAETIAAIYELTEGLIDPSHLPPKLQSHAIPLS